MTPQLKPCFYSFQRVRDQLYMTPPTVLEYTGLTGLYLGALGFTKPLEQLMLHTMPLQSLLDWLSKPKGPNLVEASVATVPEKALVLVVFKKMLYGEKPPLMGVGRVYKPHYIFPVPFSAAYVQLNIWHSAGSNGESQDKLTASHLLFVSISEMSNVIPFRGFRLHTTWTQQPGGELTRHITFPHFLGKGNSSALEYESEKFPQGLKQREVITDHWLPILQEEGLLAESPPNQFATEPDWVPLYTKDSLVKHLPAALSAFPNAGLPSLTSMVPPDFCMGTDQEFLLTNFHQPGCLGRQSFTIG